MQSTRTGQPNMPFAGTGEVGDPNRPTMTTIIQRELEDFEQRQPRRGHVVGRLIFLQVVLLLMSAPLAAWPIVQPAAIIITAVGLVLYLIAWIRNVSGAVNQARTVLIVTSLLVTAANMAGQIFWHPGQILPVGLASFPFLLTIFTAALLFQPEIVLMTGVATAAISTLIFIVALFLTTKPDVADYQIYLLAVSSLGLQALAGIMSWQISHFIMDYSSELAQARREEFIATQYDALRRSVDDQALRVRDQVGEISAGLIALSTRNYLARVNINEGELKPIADAFAVLAKELGAMAGTDQAQFNVTDDLMRLIELVGQMAEGGVAGAPMLANMPMTANATGNLLRGVIMTLQRAHGATQQRLTYMRDATVDVGQRLTQAAEQTYTTETTIATTLATIGLLRAKADNIYGSAEQLSQFIDQSLTELSGLLPPEVSAHSHIESHKPPPATTELQSVMPGVTIQLDAINDDTELGLEDFSLVGKNPAGMAAGNDFGAGTVDANAQAKLREVWSLITKMTEEVAKQVRDTQVLSEQLGISSKTMRQVDNEVIVMRQMVLQVRQLVEQIYRAASPTRTPTGPLTAPHTPPSGISAADLLNPPDSSGPNRPPSRPLRGEGKG